MDSDKCKIHFENEDGTVGSREFTWNVHTRKRMAAVREVMNEPTPGGEEGDGWDHHFSKVVRAFAVCVREQLPDMEGADTGEMLQAISFFSRSALGTTI